eukprot:GEMP01094811.1.p1 GENE.GEMP01094811.1~~GEMP01094811.1.p1  ORF type:complete len:126 (+),score=2.70 GEMP01094811.1:327-704(+)
MKGGGDRGTNQNYHVSRATRFAAQQKKSLIGAKGHFYIILARHFSEYLAFYFSFATYSTFCSQYLNGKGDYCLVIYYLLFNDLWLIVTMNVGFKDDRCRALRAFMLRAWYFITSCKKPFAFFLFF